MFASATLLLLSQRLNVCRYHSMTLLKFMGLITDFFGGKARMLAALSGQRVSPNPFPCCCCCCLPMVAINRYTPDTNLKVGLFKQLAVESEIEFLQYCNSRELSFVMMAAYVTYLCWCWNHYYLLLGRFILRILE